MEEKKNPEFKRTIGGTIAAGMKSVFNAKGKKYYTIEYKDDTRFHKRGEQQRIIVDEAFIGRDAKCQIRFDDSFPTVSREHAVIVNEGEHWKLVHRSETNATFVNGMEVTGEQALQNGDEIQLSENGPRLVFITSDTSYVNNISVGDRLNMFSQQSLRPYKIALICMAAALLLVVAGLVAYLVWNDRGTVNIKNLEEDVYLVRMTEFTLTSPSINNGEPYTFVFEDNDFPEPKATGFMTDDQRFITARHVIEPWYYETVCWDDFDQNNPFCYVNLILTCFGGKVNAVFEADSKNGKHLTFKTSDCSFSEYEYEDVFVKSGVTDKVKIRRVISYDDYAYVKRDVPSKLKVNEELSEKLKTGSKLDILGFPSSLGAKKNNIQPQYRSVVTSNNGLLDGKIVTNNTMDYGSSGSPVFYKRFGKYYIVGVVSSTIGQNGGVIIPISRVK